MNRRNTFCSHKNNYYNPAIAKIQIFRNWTPTTDNGRRDVKIGELAQMYAFPKVHTKDKQCDEKHGLYIANVIWYCKMHKIKIANKTAVSK